MEADNLDHLSKLVQMKEDTAPVIKKRFALWNEHVPKIEDAYKKVLLNI